MNVHPIKNLYVTNFNKSIGALNRIAKPCFSSSDLYANSNFVINFCTFIVRRMYYTFDTIATRTGPYNTCVGS